MQYIWQQRTKRVADIAAASTAIILLSPVISGVAAVVVTRLGRPVLFRQSRPGLRGRPFDIYKFRTMTDQRGDDGVLLSDEERLTPTGRWLRRWSLDELPELWNVVMGEMSLVGPRPLLTSYLGLYTQEQSRRHEVRPGLTGMAQVNGRNNQTWEERLSLDVWYVDHWNLRLDARILAITVARVLGGQGVSSPGSATMPLFGGE